MTSNGGTNNGSNGRRAIISKESLLPISFVLILISFVWVARGYVSDKEHAIEENERRVIELESEVKMQETKLELWRRWLESNLQIVLPEPPEKDNKDGRHELTR